jgi:Ca-activated chloride channel family protein
MRILLIILICIIFSHITWADSYNVYQPNEFKYNNFDNVNEKILFILDFSQSMTEEIQGKRKVDLMLSTMTQILPFINKKDWVGLRVYGHRMGFTQYDACKASSLLVPIMPGSSEQIKLKLAKTNPRGMTPITYSLKKAVEVDFMGFDGKKHIILLTDGGENCDESPCIWAMELIKTRKDVKIDVIAFNISNSDDLDQLNCTALVTKGEFYSANTAAELIQSLQKSLNIRKEVEAKIILNP